MPGADPTDFPFFKLLDPNNLEASITEFVNKRKGVPGGQVGPYTCPVFGSTLALSVGYAGSVRRVGDKKRLWLSYKVWMSVSPLGQALLQPPLELPQHMALPPPL